MYALVSPAGRTVRTYTTGFILRLFNIRGKCSRRDPRRGLVAVSFFRRYLPPRPPGELRLGVCRQYKRHFDFFLHTNFLPFAKSSLDGLVFDSRTLTTAYRWRRVAPIKKRIRKRLGIRSGKPKTWLS